MVDAEGGIWLKKEIIGVPYTQLFPEQGQYWLLGAKNTPVKSIRRQTGDVSNRQTHRRTKTCLEASKNSLWRIKQLSPITGAQESPTNLKWN